MPVYLSRGVHRHRTDMSVVVPITLSCRPHVLPGYKVTWNTSGTDTDFISACTPGLRLICWSVATCDPFKLDMLRDTPWCHVSHIPLVYMKFDAEAESTQYSLCAHSKKSLPVEVYNATLIDWLIHSFIHFIFRISIYRWKPRMWKLS